MELLTVQNLTFFYPDNLQPAVSDVSFSIESGEFVVVCGDTGSGKSTLLRLLKPEIAPQGSLQGQVLFNQKPVSQADSAKIGFVAQQPDEQIVTDKVYSELAFGLENMGMPKNQMAKKVAEIASYFGIEDWFDRDVSTLSGGQKQLLNLASIMVMNPELLLLDEPTSQLDPIATSDFIHTLKKLNRDFSLTIIIVEHRLEELIPLCDKLFVLQNGALRFADGPRTVIESLPAGDSMIQSMPTASRLFRSLSSQAECPLTIREGRRFLEANYENRIDHIEETDYTTSPKKALEFKDVYFRYKRNAADVLKGLSFTVYEDEIFCILGGNGSGKTTALSCASGIRKIYSGKIRVFQKDLKEYPGQSLYQNCISLLPQEVQTLFLCETVRKELKDAHADISSFPFDLSALLDKHPYDLSGGEQQLVALAKVLANNPRLLLMDEPTKGLDAVKKKNLVSILKELKKNGVTIIIVTHDVEFAALCADRCALFFRGNIVSTGTPRSFFSENFFYTTSASRMTKGFYSNTVTVEDVTQLCHANGEKE